MTVQEIEKIFRNVYDNTQNTLVAFVELAKVKEEYEKSDFFKITNLDINQAYVFFYRTSLLVEDICQVIQDIIDKIDLSVLNDNLSIDKLFDQVPPEYADIFKSLMNK